MANFQGEGTHLIRITTDGRVSEMNVVVSSKTREGMEPLSAECWAHVGRPGIGRSPRIGEYVWYKMQYMYSYIMYSSSISYNKFERLLVLKRLDTF